MPLPATTVLRRAFVDVCNGYSVARTKVGQTVYIRHLSHRNHVQFEDQQAAFEAEARAQGAQSESERLLECYGKGVWSLQREADIETQRDKIGRMEDARKGIAVPSVLRSHEEHIARERVTLGKTLNERARVIGETVETYASRLLEDYYLVHNLFADRELSRLVYPEDVFNALDDAEVDAIHELYRVAIEPCSDANLRRLAVQDFFQSCWMLGGDDAHAFYGRPICELTYYQVRLSNNARYYKALLENTDLTKLPAAQRADPDVIERLHITQKNMSTATANGALPVGMSSSDLKETGQVLSPLPPAGVSGLELVKWLQRNNKGVAR